MSTEKLIIVSGDSHAGAAPESWSTYVESAYHEHLAQAYEDEKAYEELFATMAAFPPEVLEVVDPDGVWEPGLAGVWDREVRLAEMDREGVAAEIIHRGDPRVMPLMAPIMRPLAADVVAAGARAYNRWLSGEFGPAKDRLLFIGDPTNEPDMDGMLRELRWCAEHDFFGVFLPGTRFKEGQPALYDEFFDPYWAACVDQGLPVFLHAGYGEEDAAIYNKVMEIRERRRAEADGTEVAPGIDLLSEAIAFFLDLRPRRAIWQMTLGGVFDRFPELKLVATEIRADWMPATLKHLDAAFDANRDRMPAKRRPSEYWPTNGLTVLSFVHKAEVQMREEIGVDTMLFGRDYPHAEGTWPNTMDWLRDAFAGVSEDDVRGMLGENAIRFFGLDRDKLAVIAEAVGPSLEDVVGPQHHVDERVIAAFDHRGGYLKPVERFDPDAVDAVLGEDLSELVEMTS